VGRTLILAKTPKHTKQKSSGISGSLSKFFGVLLEEQRNEEP